MTSYHTFGNLQKFDNVENWEDLFDLMEDDKLFDAWSVPQYASIDSPLLKRDEDEYFMPPDLHSEDEYTCSEEDDEDFEPIRGKNTDDNESEESIRRVNFVVIPTDLPKINPQPYKFSTGKKIKIVPIKKQWEELERQNTKKKGLEIGAWEKKHDLRRKRKMKVRACRYGSACYSQKWCKFWHPKKVNCTTVNLREIKPLATVRRRESLVPYNAIFAAKKHNL